LPHHLHAPVTLDLLRHGIHVLVEKPMALTTRDCDEMIKAASHARVVLTVGLIRRFYESSRFVKRVIESGILGDIVNVDFCEGVAYEGTMASDFRLRPETGGGVLIDMGSHVLDLLLWWLGEYDRVEYRDDAMGGVEANCKLDLRFQSGVTGIVELSWNRNLRNSSIVLGERGVLEVGTGYDSPLRLRVKDENVALVGRAMESATERTILDVFRRQFNDFVDAIRDHRAPFVPGQEGKRAVSLIEACHTVRQPLSQPWLRPEQLFMEHFDVTGTD
jgi:predicted dehydrogenase